MAREPRVELGARCDAGRILAVELATAARHVDKARERIASGVRKLLARATGIHGAELRELADLVTRQLDLSLSRVLASTE